MLFPAPESISVSPCRPIGIPSRDPALDAWPGFNCPPPGYGEVAFYWWQKDPLTRERLAWQLEQLSGMPIAGLQVNYAHSDQGGLLWGLTYETDPPLFSESWWELFNWFLQVAKQQGLSVSLSDYTLGSPGQGWYVDEIIREHPQLAGSVLKHDRYSVVSGEPFVLDLTAEPLSCLSCCLENDTVVASFDLSQAFAHNQLRWTCPPGDWEIHVVTAQRVPQSIDPMNPVSGKKVVETFFQRFEDRNPGECGSGLNFFFSDELNFGIAGNLWNDSFAAEFRQRKGYDILPELAALFEDIGPRTCKIRLDYRDVLVQLEEEHYFQPVYQWHQERGMIYGCDHGGRGKDVTEFGDYFRTQKWNQAPGNDQPNLESDIIKNKVSSSITHLYERPRTWLEGFYGSGWGTSTSQLADAIFRNFAMGHNLLSLHGLYYTTHGGHWEWAPPCNHFRMPYWPHMGELLRCSERLSYLLSQGVHCCDVALLYPVAAVEAGLEGDRSVQSAFSLAECLYANGIDFDFIDFESVARSIVCDGQLEVAGESYKFLILPAMRAIRFSTLQKALEFQRSGGIVIATDCLPETSDRAGAQDEALDAMLTALFGEPVDGAAGGKLISSCDQVLKVINDSITRDFCCLDVAQPAKPIYHQHRRIGPRDLYLVYGVPKGSSCFFRAKGSVERWDPWTGAKSNLANCQQTDEGTIVQMPLAENEIHLIVFPNAATAETQRIPDSTFNLQETTNESTLVLPELWEFELQPTLYNRWGDFELPPADEKIGARVHRLWKLDDVRGSLIDEANPSGPLPSVAPESVLPDFKQATWIPVTCTYGPHFQKLGPFPDGTDLALLGEYLAARMNDPCESVELDGQTHVWQPLIYSTRYGIEGDPGHQGYHGLKGEISDDFIGLGRLHLTQTGTQYLPETDGSGYFLWATVTAEQAETVRIRMGAIEPAKTWLNGQVLAVQERITRLQAGINTLLLFYPAAGKTHFILESLADQPSRQREQPLVMRWFNHTGIYDFDGCGLMNNPVEWFRFDAPPGLQGLKMQVHGEAQVWIGSDCIEPVECHQIGSGIRDYWITGHKPICEPVSIIIRIKPQPGHPSGAAFADCIRMDCGCGQIMLGDWALLDGLSSYSGGAWYRQTVPLQPADLTGQVILDLGDVASSAEVLVNGHRAGIRVAPAWTFDITAGLVPGANRIEILVYNTLANHYTTIPTRYRGSTRSGLLGPVCLRILNQT